MPEGDPHLFRLGDARLTPPPKPVDLILTSPPYPGVYDYLPLQQLRYSWLQFKHADRLSREVGSRRSFRSQGRLKHFQTGSPILKNGLQPKPLNSIQVVTC